MKYLVIFLSLFACAMTPSSNTSLASIATNPDIIVGASRTKAYFIHLKNKRVAVVANATSTIGTTHLVDSLLEAGINVVKVFAPEHGFRGNHGAGDKVSDERDAKTGLPLVSLYGKNKKPSAEMLQDVDVIVFDIQDVGARFYTYISTMHYVMEAANEQGKELIILDRPNPNGHYVDGPVWEKKFTSFVGMHPIPMVHGLTVGELAMMIAGEKWIANSEKLKLSVIPVVNYTHADFYSLPIAPSPNLPNMSAIYAYPSLCLFEGTMVSIGRGTDKPFQCFGFPSHKNGVFSFTPQDIAGIVNNPPYEGQLCHGHLVDTFSEYYFQNHGEIYLNWLISMFEESEKKDAFFTEAAFFDKLAGTDKLRKDLLAGKNEDYIRKSWESDLSVYKIMRKKYLLYADFE
jgi:uncharacterized protein YbbC (DUF1343 family)